MKEKYFRCEKCGNIVALVKESGVPVMCCGQKMTELKANTVEASQEKHIPVYEVKDNKVVVLIGSIEHPMVEEHYIEWVVVETKYGTQRKELKPNQEPKVCFSLCEGDEVKAVYAYCNLHGLWGNVNE